MWDSILIEDTIEVMGGPGGVPMGSGPAAGCYFRLDQGSKKGAANPETTFTQTLLLDGSRPVGSRSANRQMELPVLIYAPGRIPLAFARDLLLQLVDQETWQLTYTPDGLPPVVYDCFRATVDLDQTTYKDEMQFYCKVHLTFEALPFGRSTDLETILVSPDTGEQPESVLLDGFETPPDYYGSLTGWYKDTHVRISGSSSVFRWDSGNANRNFPAKDLSQCTSVRVYTTMAGKGIARAFTLALHDINGKQYNAGMHQRVLAGNYKWEQFTWTLNWPKDFDPTQVTGYYLNVSGGVYLDDLRGLPSYQARVTSTRGGMYLLPGVKGTARAPLNLEISKASGDLIQRLLVHRPPQDAPAYYTPLIPLDDTQIPDGTEQAFPTVDGVAKGIRFNGTYSVFANVTTWAGAGTRDITVTIRQFYNDSGVTGDSGHAGKALTVTVDPSVALVNLGSMTLPLIDGAADNSEATYTCGVTSSNTGDRISDVLLLDTRGETLFISTARSCPTIFVDEPDTPHDPYDMIGKILGGSDRAHALSVAGEALLPYRPLSALPGDNRILLYDTSEAVQARISYNSRWRTVRTA